MVDEITVSQLVTVLEHETHNDAAERIRCGADARGVLSQLGEPRYHDAASGDAADLFASIVDGRRHVVADAW
jgi:hypothetical protein